MKITFRGNSKACRIQAIQIEDNDLAWSSSNETSFGTARIAGLPIENAAKGRVAFSESMIISTGLQRLFEDFEDLTGKQDGNGNAVGEACYLERLPSIICFPALLLQRLAQFWQRPGRLREMTMPSSWAKMSKHTWARSGGGYVLLWVSMPLLCLFCSWGIGSEMWKWYCCICVKCHTFLAEILNYVMHWFWIHLMLAGVAGWRMVFGEQHFCALRCCVWAPCKSHPPWGR